MKIRLLCITALLFCVELIFATPLPNDGSLVISSTTAASKEGETSKLNELAPTEPLVPTITQMYVRSNVSNRYAKTLVTSKVKNPDKASREATFFLVLPEDAFISEFVMEIGGKSYKAYVKAKEEAKQIYDQAKASGQSAAHVAVSARDSNKFSVSVNIEAEGKATFFLTYEELLKRQNDMYELVLNIHPRQIVKDLKIEVHVNESRPLTFVKTPSLRSGNEISKSSDKLTPSSEVQTINLTSAVVKFEPSVEDQKNFGIELGNKEGTGLSGQFIVQYSVEKDPQGGEVLLEDGYFVHFFAPSDLQPLPKQVIFVLDTSGSMSGDKIEQLRDAMRSILDQIKGDNLLSIVTFSSGAEVYNIKHDNTVMSSPFDDFNLGELEEQFKALSDNTLPESVETTDEIIEKAKKIASNLRADGLTNMMSGLLTSLTLVYKAQNKHQNKYQPIIIFLTDGQPTSSSSDQIIEHITKLNKKINAPIFSLSFGYGADKSFLREFSNKNQGFSRHIYQASDASLQLQEFYKQISSPLLSNVVFKYEDNVENVTKTVFPIYFNGSELVVAGRYDRKQTDIPVAVNCWGPHGRINLKPTIARPVSSLERLWAYLTVKQILQERDFATNKTNLTQKALDLALKYSFVTDVTSLVVVKPNETSAVDTQDGSSFAPDSVGMRRLSLSPSSSYYPAGVGLRTFYSAPSISAIQGGVPKHASAHIGYSANSFRQYNMLTGNRGNRPNWASIHKFGPNQGLHGMPQFPNPTTPVYWTTTKNKPQSLKDQLPWLAVVLNSNGTLTLPQGSFDIGENSSFADRSIECQKPLGNKNLTKGTCTLLKDCPQAIHLLTDFDTFKQHFCPLDNNRYAGICCDTS